MNYLPYLIAAVVPASHTPPSAPQPTTPSAVHTAPQGPPKPAIPARPKLVIAPSDKIEKEPRPLQNGAPMGELFFYPGVISKDGTGGQDNFLNLSRSIAVQVNFIKAEGLESSFPAEQFQELIASTFQKGGISPTSAGTSPLPFFNMLIMVFQTADGLAAVCQGRLFEQVQVSRVQLRDQVFQAITWEQTNIIFGPQEDFERMLAGAIENISNTFVTRVKSHQAATPDKYPK